MQKRHVNLMWASLAALVLGCTPGTPSNPVPDMSPAPDLAVSRDLASPPDMGSKPPVYTMPQYFVHPVAKSAGAKLTQTWIYKDPELSLHPDIPQHYANDLQVPWGTPIYAAADGYMICSYEVSRETEPDPANPGVTRQIGFARGLFCQIYHPGMVDEDGNELYSLYEHLSGLSNPADYKAPKHIPPMGPDDWSSADYFTVSPADFVKMARVIKQGDEIGYAGFTGLGIGPGEQPNYPPDVKSTDPTWDPAGAHLHWQLIVRHPTTFGPLYSVDPYKIHRQMGSRYNDVFIKARGLMIANPDGSPKFAR
jgi:murein DD-endopeptidase MepM/ murein hydrolase activator NlpD